MSSYLRRLPNLIARLFWFLLFVVVGIIRVAWLLIIAFFVVGLIAALFGITFSWQWMVPILVVFRRRALRPALEPPPLPQPLGSSSGLYHWFGEARRVRAREVACAQAAPQWLVLSTLSSAASGIRVTGSLSAR